MMAIPVITPGRKLRLIIILEQENLDRITTYDPCEMDYANFPAEYGGLRTDHISICYANPDEMEKIQALARQDRLPEILQIIGRGYRVNQSDLKRGKPYEIIAKDEKPPS